MATNEQKELAQQIADEETANEQRRIQYYRSLKYAYSPLDFDEYITLTERPLYPQPTKRSVYRDLRFSLLDRFRSLFDATTKDKIEKQVQRELEKQEKDYRVLLKKRNTRIQNRHAALINGDPNEIIKFVQTSIENNPFVLGYTSQTFYQQFDLRLHCSAQTLVIDYDLPTSSEIPKTGSWKPEPKSGRAVQVPTKQTDFLALYETLLFDIALRIVGIAYRSYQHIHISSIIFNGYLSYEDKRFGKTGRSCILSVNIPRSQFDKIEDMNKCVSKFFFSACEKAVYLGKLNSETPAKGLDTCPPGDVIPLQPENAIQHSETPT